MFIQVCDCTWMENFLLPPRAKAIPCSPECPCQEQKTGDADKNLWSCARVQLPSTGFYHMLGQGSRAEAGSQPCRAQVTSWCCCWGLGSFCPDGIREPASDPAGKELLSGEGACPECSSCAVCEVRSLQLTWQQVQHRSALPALYILLNFLDYVNFSVCVMATNSSRGSLSHRALGGISPVPLLSVLLGSHPWTRNLPGKG